MIGEITGKANPLFDLAGLGSESPWSPGSDGPWLPDFLNGTQPLTLPGCW
jgi:hypothetical protein